MSAFMSRLLAVLTIVLVGSSCAAAGQGSDVDPEQVDAVEAPELGACRELAPGDVALSSNATRTVACTDSHTAQTFAVGELPDEFRDVDYEDPDVGIHVYRTCNRRFQKLVGGDESLAMRSILSWVWFRPSESAWGEGARWYRCDVIGGGDRSESYVELPTQLKGLLHGKVDDSWLACADGRTVASAERVPCSESHTWRAVTTIKLGEPEDPYPGDKAVEQRTHDFCDQSVAAVLGYPVRYDYGYTWFGEAQWKAGNRRSVCWARTDE